MNQLVPAPPPLAVARSLALRFAAKAAHHDRTGKTPAANFDALLESGLLALPIAREKGGRGAGLAEAQAVVSAVAGGEPSTALILAMHYVHHGAMARGRRWPERVQERLIREAVDGLALINAAQVEPATGSPAHGARPTTLARRTPDGWRISGRKQYVTGIPILSWISVLAVTDEAEPRLGSFLVPARAPGLGVVPTWNALGMRATASHDIVLEDVRIPPDHATDLNPVEAKPPRDPVQTAWFFTLVGAVYHGIARAARDWLVAFAARTAPPSLGAPLSSVPRIQDLVGRIEVLLAVNERMLRSTGEDVDAGRPVADVQAVRHSVIDNAVLVTDLALEAAGNPGLSRDCPLERHHRDALCGRSHAPQNNMIRALAASAAFAAHQP